MDALKRATSCKEVLSLYIVGQVLPGIGAKAAWWWESCLCEVMMSRSRADLSSLNSAGNALPTLFSD